eukprot:c42698_g1_i1 orf=35-217(-)
MKHFKTSSGNLSFILKSFVTTAIKIVTPHTTRPHHLDVVSLYTSPKSHHTGQSALEVLCQ